MWVSVSTLCLLFALCGGREVTLPDLGTLDGTTTLSSWTNRTIYQYQGIPFAEPPIGSLRFKRPLPYKEKWTTTFNASDFGPVCPQNNGVPMTRGRQDEDCLHINIYTPRTGGGGVGTGMPVMVYIHGGSFRVGSARNILPNYLLEEDVVLAVPQYRLGPLGFLSLKTDEVPGNQGMLDILLALEWVHKNIQYFGGDPNRVTIFGQSAGAAAATLMLFSPLVKDGLIERVIGISGSFLSSWASDPEPVAHTRTLAARVNCNQDDVTDLVGCLRDRTSVKQLLDAHAIYLKEGSNGRSQIVWNEAGNNSFLLDDPYVLLKEGKFKHLPLLSGVTKHECSFCVTSTYDRLKFANLTTSENFLSYNLIPLILDGVGISDRTGFVTNLMKDKYFKDDDFKDYTRMVPGIMDITGVAVMKAGVLTMTSEMSRWAHTYLYSFNYFGNSSSYGNFGTFGQNPEQPWNYPFSAGIAHGDDLLYVFPQEYAILCGKDKLMAKRMVQFITSFVKTGVPKAEGFPDWPKVITGKGPYMKIEKTPTVHDDFIDEFYIATNEGLTPEMG